MLFNSIEFLIFFICVILVLILIKQRHFKLLFLLGASYYFYYSSSGNLVLLLFLISVVNFLTGNTIYKTKNLRHKKIYLALGTVSTLCFLGVFKYFNFGMETISSIANCVGVNFSTPLLNFVLPIGISFYSFSALSYIFDIYRNELEPTKSFCKFALFISYFPHLLAGPIVRANQFLPQLKNNIEINPENLKNGISIIAWGFVKKFVIADNIALVVDKIFSQPTMFPSIYIILGTFLFGIQIFCDFSGYCDIAIGLARIIGLHLPLNFIRPYLSKNPTDFWRRWNITLSSFIRDYIYITLGGNRHGKVRTYLNLIGSMLLCGLWHGAAWNFVIWGGYHGILLSIDKILKRNLRIGTKISFFTDNHAGYVIKILITQYFIFFGWLIFRVGNTADLFYCIQKFLIFDFILSSIERIIVITLFLGFVVFLVILSNKKFADHLISCITKDWPAYFASLPMKFWIIYLTIMFFIYLAFSPLSSAPFIYFQF